MACTGFRFIRGVSNSSYPYNYYLFPVESKLLNGVIESRDYYPTELFFLVELGL